MTCIRVSFNKRYDWFSYSDIILHIWNWSCMTKNLFSFGNFPFLSNNVPASAYGVFVLQLKRYIRACCHYGKANIFVKILQDIRFSLLETNSAELEKSVAFCSYCHVWLNFRMWIAQKSSKGSNALI